jgi:hypothetical protein
LEKDNFANKSTIAKENVRLCTITIEKKMKKMLCKVKIDKKNSLNNILKTKNLPYRQWSIQFPRGKT